MEVLKITMVEVCIMYWVILLKTQSSIQFEPLDTFKDNNGKPIYKLLDLSPDFIYYAANIMPIDSEKEIY